MVYLQAGLCVRKGDKKKYWITLCTGKIIQSSGAKKCLQWQQWVSEWVRKKENKLHLTFKLLVSFSENLIFEIEIFNLMPFKDQVHTFESSCQKNK